MVEIISSRLVPECKRRARRRSSIDSMVKALPDFIASSNGTGCDAAICSDATASTIRFFAPIIAGVGLICRAHLQFKIAYSPVAFQLTERKISPSKIGCHSTDRAVTFDFLDSCSFFFFPFFLPCPVATVSKADERTGTSGSDHLRTIETALPFFSAIARRANDVRNDDYDCLVASARFQYFPIRRSFYEKLLWPIKRFILETRSSGTSLHPNFPFVALVVAVFEHRSRYDLVVRYSPSN